MLCFEVHFIKTSTTTGSNYYSRILKGDAYTSLRLLSRACATVKDI